MPPVSFSSLYHAEKTKSECFVKKKKKGVQIEMKKKKKNPLCKVQERKSKFPHPTKRNPQLPGGRASVPLHLSPALTESQQLAKGSYKKQSNPSPTVNYTISSGWREEKLLRGEERRKQRARDGEREENRQQPHSDRSLQRLLSLWLHSLKHCAASLPLW